MQSPAAGEPRHEVATAGHAVRLCAIASSLADVRDSRPQTDVDKTKVSDVRKMFLKFDFLIIFLTHGKHFN